jgi:transposase, IS30 family
MPKSSQKGFSHLTQAKRDRMEALFDVGEKQDVIAKVLKVNQSTVSREWQRRMEAGYDAEVAHQKARVKRINSKYQGMKVEQNTELKAHVIAELKKKRSPDEIAGRMKYDKLPFYASKNAIYKWLYSVYGEKYCRYLCTKRKRKQQRKHPASKRVMIPNRIGIALRPMGATNKTRYGHFEGDTAVAPRNVENREAIAVVVERISKFFIGTKIPNLSPVQMAKAIQNINQRANIKSMTLDNGIENQHHGSWGTNNFFADAHSPWQKPVIENNIGLLRRWRFPKGTDWKKVSEEELQDAILFLNMKYRKSLKYQNALEVARAHKLLKMPEEN